MAAWVARHDLRCHACTESMQKVRGCNGLEESRELDGTDVEVDRCPVKAISAFARNVMSMNVFYSRGFLPYAGGFLDQPAKLMDALELFARELCKGESNG